MLYRWSDRLLIAALQLPEAGMPPQHHAFQPGIHQVIILFILVLMNQIVNG